jgi:hypothetical protein
MLAVRSGLAIAQNSPFIFYKCSNGCQCVSLANTTSTSFTSALPLKS